MDIIIWILIGLLLVLSFVGLIYPIIPGAICLLGAFLLYGFYFSFDDFHWFFWIVQSLLFILLFAADHAVNLLGVKKYGGSKAGIWGSTIGLILGPFILPFLGVLLGPFLGAVLAEMLFEKRPLKLAVKVGFGSVIAFTSSVFVKAIIMIIMTAYFLMVVL